jgi:hypothetical protein
MGSSTQETSKNENTTPWAPQAAALTDAFGKAQTAYGQASQAQAPTDFVAQFTPDQLGVFKSMLGYGTGTSTAGTSATGNALQTAGTNATQGALSGLTNYDPTKLNNTQSISDAANQYVSGQNIDAQVNNAMLNARQTARDVTLPGIDQAAAGSGNANSSRAGIAQGLVERGLAQQSADLGASLRSQAYQQGLQLASNNANANNTNSLGALTGAAGAGTNAANSGVNASSSAINDQKGLYDLATGGASGQQQAQQANLDNQNAQFQSGTQSPYAALQGLMGIIGSNNWGGQTTGSSTTTKTPSAWDVIGGLMGAGGNAASMFKAFSDERLKTDIKRVGTLDNGLPVYLFRYRGSSKIQMGVMAQDVEQVLPDAVEDFGSYKIVDYEKATA